MVTAVPDIFVKDIEAFLNDTHVSDFCKTPIDRLAREFLSVERSAEQVRELSRFAQISPASRVLEVGSGFGTLSIIAAPIMFATVTVWSRDCRRMLPHWIFPDAFWTPPVLLDR